MEHPVRFTVFSYFLASIILFSIGIGNGWAESVIPLSGTVADMSTNQPIASVTVSSSTGTEVQTNPQGITSLIPFHPGSMTSPLPKPGIKV